MPKACFEPLEICSNWTEKNILISWINFFWIVTVQIQTRHSRDHIGKQNTTITLQNWNIIMFDHEGVKTTKIFELSFCMSNLKSW